MERKHNTKRKNQNKKKQHLVQIKTEYKSNPYPKNFMRKNSEKICKNFTHPTKFFTKPQNHILETTEEAYTINPHFT